MDFDRRALLVGSMAVALSGCGRSTAGKAAVKEMRTDRPRLEGWAPFKTAFLAPEGRIVDTGNNGISHSEGQGYGLLFAEAAGDRGAFDRMLDWTQKTLARPYDALYAWRYAPHEPTPVSDPNNATDGDMLIAWALMRAGDRWGEAQYHDRAATIRAAIADHCVRRVGGRTLLLPGVNGFDKPDLTTVNMSYYVWPALDRFRMVEDEPVWQDVTAQGETLLDEARTGAHALPTDWTDVPVAGPVAPAADKPPRFGFDAVRVPLYLAMGDRPQKAESMARFWQHYADQGQDIPAWVDVISGERAPYALSTGGYAVVRRVLGRDVPHNAPPQKDYYSSALELLAHL
ncbi:MAG: endoglucanase [Sphingobium sp.]|nr:MAG: endoglucanase [Sphingobium sp.]